MSRRGANLGIIAVGKSSTIESLKSLGIDTCTVKSLDEETSLKVCEKIFSANVVIIEEDLYNSLKPKISVIASGMKNPPIFIIIPGPEAKETSRLKDLYAVLSKAVGVKLRWVK